MKKIIIYICLIFSLIINLTPVHATTYANYSYKLKVYYTDITDDPNLLSFDILDKDKIIVNDNPTVSIVDGMVYLYVSTGSISQNSNYYLDVYLDGEYHSQYNFFPSTASEITIRLVGEDTGDSGESTETTENTESSESSEGSESSENSSSSTESTEDSEGTLSEDYLKVIHNDLLILILIIGFFEFMKMIQIIVRNISGGDR